MEVLDTFGSFGSRLTKMGEQFSGPELTKIVHAVAVKAQGDAESAVVATLGPLEGFSNWRRGKVIKLGTKVVDSGVGVATLLPSGGSAGPWTVAESGRHPMSGPRITSGGKSGVRKVSRARQKRYSGETSGFQTASKAHVLMAAKNVSPTARTSVKIPGRMVAESDARLLRIWR